MQKSKSENSKEKILAAATKLFAQKGFDGVSIREICKEAEVNICMISYYWGGKKELYQGII
ncbi:TPA: TetR/AcrR family transcriptional regulator [Candidatus Spyradomonas excrementavium]|nr:TetR/AcrR family transcriptional regulator [Candidatus Spyradomonas excrementavium]